MELTSKDLTAILLKALQRKQYQRFSKDLWLLPIVCPEFLNRCKVKVLQYGVSIELDYPTKKLMAQVIPIDAPPDLSVDTEDLREAYMTYLDMVDPTLNIILEGLPVPKVLWDLLYSLASIVFNMKVGRGGLNLLAPYTYIQEGKIVLEVRQISEEEAPKVVEEWLYKFAPADRINDIKAELYDERLITQDLRPLVRLNLLYEVIALKGARLYSEKITPPQVKKCPYCGAEFSTYNKRAVFCSNSCASTFQSGLIRKGLSTEYQRIKDEYIQAGLPTEEAVEKAVHQMIEKYPFLSKVKRQELGIVGRRGKKKKEPQPIHATQPQPEKVEEEDPLEILKQFLFGEDQKE